jgi:hypothetical protein
LASGVKARSPELRFVRGLLTRRAVYRVTTRVAAATGPENRRLVQARSVRVHAQLPRRKRSGLQQVADRDGVAALLAIKSLSAAWLMKRRMRSP